MVHLLVNEQGVMSRVMYRSTLRIPEWGEDLPQPVPQETDMTDKATKRNYRVSLWDLKCGVATWQYVCMVSIVDIGFVIRIGTFWNCNTVRRLINTAATPSAICAASVRRTGTYRGSGKVAYAIQFAQHLSTRPAFYPLDMLQRPPTRIELRMEDIEEVRPKATRALVYG